MMLEWMERSGWTPPSGTPPQRGILRWREEAERDPADGPPRARAGHPGRDRLGPRRRRPPDRGRGCQHRSPDPSRPRGAGRSPITSGSQELLADRVHLSSTAASSTTVVRSSRPTRERGVRPMAKTDDTARRSMWRRSARTSRCSTAGPRAAARLPRLGHLPPAPGPVLDAMGTTTRPPTPTSTAASTPSPRRPPVGSRRRAAKSDASSERPIRQRGRLHQERHRGPQPGGPRLGTDPPPAPATPSSSPRWSTTPTSSPGRCWRPSAASNIRWIPVDDDGAWSCGLDELLDGVKLLGVTCMSNVLGTLNPVADIAEAAHAAGAVVVADGAQSVPHLPTDVTALGVDFLAFSAHKMLGPPASGCSGDGRSCSTALPPFLGGGEMILRRPQGGVHAERRPVAIRGRNPADRRGHRAGGGGRLPAGRRAWSESGRTRSP